MSKTTLTQFTPSRRAVLAGLAASPFALAAGSHLAMAQPTSGTLSIAVFDWAEIGVKPVFAAYEAARPGVKIEYSVIPSAELRQALLSRRLANKLPDITYLADIYATQLANAEVTADMRPFLTSGGPIGLNSLAKPFLDQYLITSGPNKDGIFGLPIGADTVVLYYNKKHFDDAGIPYPDDTWTFEKQIEVATQLTQKNGSVTTRYGLAASVPWHATYVPGIEAFGDTLLDENNMYKLQTEAAIKVFTMYWGPGEGRRSRFDAATEPARRRLSGLRRRHRLDAAVGARADTADPQRDHGRLGRGLRAHHQRRPQDRHGLDCPGDHAAGHGEQQGTRLRLPQLVLLRGRRHEDPRRRLRHRAAGRGALQQPDLDRSARTSVRQPHLR
ncbi:ABC transporter substrate-binding protein [Devosia sp.]|uniref:ABC transporter substrate-binding protein n=1 Tax=Devosia sp. TaxID=1871048 RepID=UPI003F6F58CF